MGGKIAYVMSRFPSVAETFILREMSELDRQGWDIAVYPLIRQDLPVVHEESRAWIPRIREIPFFSIPVLAANLRLLLRRPFDGMGTFVRVVWENRSSFNFLVRAISIFPKAVYAAELMQSEGIQHIHAHFATHPALLAWMVHHLSGISYSITVHAHDIFVRQAMLATKLRDAAFIVAISDYNVEYMAQLVGDWIREKTHVIHCGIQPADYVSRSGDPVSDGTLEIINIGSLQPYKGQRYLLQACALLRDRGIPFRCRIIGDGYLRQELERMAVDLELFPYIEFLGSLPQEEVARVLPTGTCYAQPSIILPSGRMEGIPVALMEAMATALPVVATAISGVPELVRDGETGYLVPPEDVKNLADALSRVYSDPATSIRLARAGRELVQKEFDLRVNVAQLAPLFEAVVQRNDLLGVESEDKQTPNNSIRKSM